MITLLAKIFIKNYKEYNNSEVRSKYGVLCGAFGIFLNIILFGAKLFFGLLSASVAMIADAFNNLSDAASSIVTILGFKLANKKPDLDHPFGHGRIEYISGLVISFLIFTMSVELFKSSIKALFNPAAQELNISSIIIMIFAVLIKLYMYFYNHSVAKKIHSVSVEATAKDSLSDTVSTFVVIASLVLQQFTTLPVDGIAGLIVAGFIFFTGIEAAKDTIRPLLGSQPDPEFVLEVEKEVLKYKPIVGIHDLVVHDYGPGRLMISLHAEVPGEMDIFEMHDVIDVAEVAVSKKFNCHTVIHLDPIDLNNPLLNKYKDDLTAILSEVSKDISFHDVRMVPGTSHTNLIFDIVRPYDLQMPDEQLVEHIKSKIAQKTPNTNCVITIDNPYTTR